MTKKLNISSKTTERKNDALNIMKNTSKYGKPLRGMGCFNKIFTKLMEKVNWCTLKIVLKMTVTRSDLASTYIVSSSLNCRSYKSNVYSKLYAAYHIQRNVIKSFKLCFSRRVKLFQH
jgi:hypothetical protein